MLTGFLIGGHELIPFYLKFKEPFAVPCFKNSSDSSCHFLDVSVWFCVCFGHSSCFCPKLRKLKLRGEKKLSAFTSKTEVCRLINCIKT